MFRVAVGRVWEVDLLKGANREADEVSSPILIPACDQWMRLAPLEARVHRDWGISATRTHLNLTCLSKMLISTITLF